MSLGVNSSCFLVLLAYNFILLKNDLKSIKWCLVINIYLFISQVPVITYPFHFCFIYGKYDHLACTLFFKIYLLLICQYVGSWPFSLQLACKLYEIETLFCILFYFQHQIEIQFYRSCSIHTCWVKNVNVNNLGKHTLEI